ncbi:hypothetical protein ACOSQ3_015246 [Xanthoceras sorbifolium]
MRFDNSEFSIQIHNVRLLCMMKEIELLLGKQIGVVRELDLGASGDCVGRYLRVRIVVDVTKPLKRCIKVDIDDPEKPTIMILRNSLLDGNLTTKDDVVIPWCRSYVSSFLSLAKEMILRPVSRFTWWIPPDERTVELNTDTTIDNDKGVIGLGFAIRD